MVKKLFGIIGIMVLLLILIPIGTDNRLNSDASAGNSDSEINSFLSNSGVPTEIAAIMPYGQKEMIYNTIGDKDAEFCGYDVRGFELSDMQKSVLISENNEVGFDSDDTDLELSVVGFKSAVDSDTEYYMYPSFVWKTPVKVKNDSFAMSMGKGWEAVPGERKLQLHLYNYEGESAQQTDLNPNCAGSSGYVYNVPSNMGFMQGMYRGYGYYMFNMTSAAAPDVSLYYVYDNSLSKSASYSLNVGEYGNMSVCDDVSQIIEMSVNFNISD